MVAKVIWQLLVGELWVGVEVKPLQTCEYDAVAALKFDSLDIEQKRQNDRKQSKRDARRPVDGDYGGKNARSNRRLERSFSDVDAPVPDPKREALH